MTLQLFGHPFSSYTWKGLIPFYENATPFDFRSLEDAGNNEELAKRWPLAKFPLLVDGETQVFEATMVIEYLDAFHPGAVRFIPDDPRAAITVRQLDRVFDNYVMNVMQVPVSDSIRPVEQRDPIGVAQARAGLEKIYDWLEGELAGRAWAAGDEFTLADCAAAGAIFYADWVQEIGDARPVLRAYRARLLARPSVARCIEEARPYRAYFPLGAPDRD